jgi:hypothetical protein
MGTNEHSSPRPLARVGQTLYDYDLQLSDYALGNVRCRRHDPWYADWLSRQLDPPALRDHVLGDGAPGAGPDRLALNDDELSRLRWAVADLPPGRRPRWVPCEPLHERHVLCVKEVRDELTRQDAEEWSAACARFAATLSEPSLPLAEGIDVIRDWLRHLRRRLRALGADDLLPYPEGRSRTPTTPAPAGTAPAADGPWGNVGLAGPRASALEALRRVIAGHPLGAVVPAKDLIPRAGVSNQRGRDALRQLEAGGEYRRFARRRPRRYPPAERPA